LILASDTIQRSLNFALKQGSERPFTNIHIRSEAMQQDPIVRLAGVLFLGILAGLFLFRWDLVASDEAIGRTVHHKLDRWTGNSYFCGMERCYLQEMRVK
jgi:hypothetical protein